MPQTDLERIAIKPFFADQQEILFWGVTCGYCGTTPGMFVNFLAGNNCTLTDEERADVIEYVAEHVGEVKRNKQNREVFDVLDNRRDSES